MPEARAPGKDYANYGGGAPDGADDLPPPRGGLNGLLGMGLGCLMCCACIWGCMFIAWIVFVIVTLSDTPPLPEGCQDSGLAYFPGSIYDFVFDYLIYTMVLPLIIGCLLAVLGASNGLGRLVSFFNLAAALYFPVWGIQMWTHISDDCEKAFGFTEESGPTEYSNLYMVFQVEVVLSVLSGLGAIGDICRPTVEPASLEGYGYQRFDTAGGRAPTAPSPETEGFV